MFRRAITLPFKLLGIPIRLDMSFLLILPLFAFLIASQLPAYVHLFAGNTSADNLTQGATPYLLGLIAAIGLFTSVLIHELGHAVIARIYGVETKEITLWFLGGLARFDDMPKQKGAEAITAIAGPITSILLAGVFWLLFRTPHNSAALAFVLGYLMTTNAALAIFNLLPALPLDGGRVLRSLLALRMPYIRATNVAGIVSRIIAILLGIYGLLNQELFLLAIAFFIYNAVTAETQYARISEGLEHLTVKEVMSTEVSTVYPDMPLSQFIRLMYYKHHTGYPVVDFEDNLIGFIRLRDASQFGENQEDPDLDTKTVADIMSKAETAFETDNALETLKRIASSQMGRFVVLNQLGKMVGIVSKTDLIKAIQNQGRSPTQTT
ncbi:MAG: site-2 protease family protein [Trueperaceae bacterium]|nr:site-2 protease family protein [Trueperaceae bacterium]